MFHVPILSAFVLVFSCLSSDACLPLVGFVHVPSLLGSLLASLKLPPLSLLEDFSAEGPELPCVLSTVNVSTIANYGTVLGRFPVLSKVTGRVLVLTPSEKRPDESHHLAVAPSKPLPHPLFQSSCTYEG